MEDAVQFYTSTNQFMGTVLVARGDSVLFNRAYGAANLEFGVPNAANTRFRVGSLTKQFTAAAVLLLEERGKLHVEDRINAHIPNPPKAWDSITIFQLLTHTSGIPSLMDFPDYPQLRPFAILPARLVETLAKRPLDFVPGSRMSYSNSGYDVLGYLIEQVAGEPYAQFLQENFLTPLDMKDTGYESGAAVVPQRASGYVQGALGWENAPFVNMTVLYAAAGLYSTTSDLLRWERGLFGGRVLSAESLRKMTTAYSGDYGLGVYVDKANGHRRVSHVGKLEGFSSDVIYYPDEQIMVAVLGNTAGSAPEAMARELGSIAEGDDAASKAKKKEITLAPEVLRRYVGTYEISAGVNLYVRFENGGLTEEVTGQRRTKMMAESETRFFTRPGAVLEFSGETATILQYGRERTASRKSTEVAEKAEVDVPASELAEYTGDYQLPGLRLTVAIQDGKLMGRVPGQAPFGLFAEAADQFFLKVVDARIEFVRDGGRVSGVVLRQGPREERGERVK
ncbi:MAG TPA: serine hydrolase [Bryobacteraceae bacterium]|jgi:CubicO group peptidase (beta-lactamase class C family)